jgi:hypothetical protein
MLSQSIIIQLSDLEANILSTILSNLHCFNDSSDPRTQHLIKLINAAREGLPRPAGEMEAVCEQLIKDWQDEADEDIEFEPLSGLELASNIAFADELLAACGGQD